VIEPDRFEAAPLAPRHDGDASNNRKYRLSRGTDVLSVRYFHPSVRVHGSDLCVTRTVGINLSARIGIVLRRGTANINRLLGNASSKTRIAHETAYPLPYELMEMIVAHATRAHTTQDLDTLKALSLTCRSWYIAVVPHLHHTLSLRDNRHGTTRDKLKPLSQLYQLGLMPLVKELRMDQWHEQWFVPEEISRRDLRYFSAFTNVQTLSFQCLDISRFIPGIERYFGHFLPTLRSITLISPFCTCRQLSFFRSFFPNLDNFKVYGPIHEPNKTIPDSELVPFSTPRLRG
jgi:hypothetical protein